MRGTKLEAWRIPPVWTNLRGTDLKIPENSTVPQKQQALIKSTLAVLEAIASDVRNGLLETVGVESVFSTDDGRCSMRLALPPATDTELIARAIDLENIESWLDAEKRVHIGISPWYSTKDVDQAVLCTIKVIHVLLGIHASDNAPPKSFGQKILASIADVMSAQKTAQSKKD